VAATVVTGGTPAATSGTSVAVASTRTHAGNNVHPQSVHLSDPRFARLDPADLRDGAVLSTAGAGGKTERVRVGAWGNKTFTWVETVDPACLLPAPGPGKTGTVKDVRGKWGFIRDDECPSYDLFFHMTEVAPEHREGLRRGAAVAYTIEQDPWRHERKSKLKAVRVMRTLRRTAAAADHPGCAAVTNNADAHTAGGATAATMKPCRSDAVRDWRAPAADSASAPPPSPPPAAPVQEIKDATRSADEVGKTRHTKFTKQQQAFFRALSASNEGKHGGRPSLKLNIDVENVRRSADQDTDGKASPSISRP
jgi:cold shock CspA family protein